MRILYLLFELAMTLAQAQENFIRIDGSTNVNTFRCVNNHFNAEYGVYIFTEKKLPNIILKIKDFDCGNKMMTKDFQNILNAEKYPDMILQFISFTKMQNNYIAVVEVRMMNQSKRYSVTFEVENHRLIGRKTVKFSDFKITPPKKMGGMIVVKDNLDLTFSLATKI